MAAADQNISTGRTSDYACIFCKGRKVKCDRTLPCCSICQKTGQECKYPSEAMKPGPKIGSSKRSRKRARSGSLETTRPIRKPRQESTEASHKSSSHQGLDMTSVLDDEADNQRSGIAVDSYPLSPATTPLDIRTLAYLVHPSHDIASIHDTSSPSDIEIGGETITGTQTHTITHACSVLGISGQALSKYIDLYFENVTAFSLFHRPSFISKMEHIASPSTLIALLASICSLSARFRPDSGPLDLEHEYFNPVNLSHPPHYFETIAQHYVEEALRECSHNAPSLHLLQALVLVTFQRLTKGVRGAAWRGLGVCTRAAYELNLHRVDFENVPETEQITAWCDIEERRRTWWAIWEMDTFASTIKRCPTGIDWSDNETRLPVDDEYWYKREYHSSCFLEKKPNHRLAALQQCKNNGRKAWFIVLNSFMRDGHVASHFRSPRPGDGRYGASSASRKYVAKDTADQLAILANALTCFGMALPKELQYRDEFLTFTSRDPTAVQATKELHCAKFSIHVMTQLARLMIHHHDAYQGALEDLDLPGSSPREFGASPVSDTPSLKSGPQRKGFQECMAASDELLLIVSRSSQDHVRYVNPFVASTIWYGAAVHLTWKVLAPPTENFELIFSKYEVMRMSFDEATAFWDLPKSLSVNLRAMEEQIMKFKSPRRFSTSYYSTGRPNPSSHDRSRNQPERRSSAPQFRAVSGEDTFEGNDLPGINPNNPSFADRETLTPHVETNIGETEAENSFFAKSNDEFNFDLFVPASLSTSLRDTAIAPRGLWDNVGLDMEFAADSEFRGLLQCHE